MTTAPSSRLLPASRRQPCPICRRPDGDCRISSTDDLVICHRGTRFGPPEGLKPGETTEGSDGRRWAYARESSDGRGAVFTLDKPKDGSRRPAPRRQARTGNVVPLRPTPTPAPITGEIVLARLPEPWPSPPAAHRHHGYIEQFSPTQWVEVVRPDPKGKAAHKPRHIGEDGEVAKAMGPAPWPLYGEAEALEAEGWVVEAEGPKCADWVRAGGVVGISQPGHAHKPEYIEPRYRRLQAAGVAGVVFLADHDGEGQNRMAEAAGAAAAIGLPFLPLPAVTVWPDIPEKGSIDDALGSAAERVAAIEAAIPAALEQYRREQQERSGAPAAKPQSVPYRVLGWCQDRKLLFYQHRQTGQIANIKPAASAGPLLQLAPLAYWEALYPSKAGVNWNAAGSDVIEAANTAGVFDLRRVRGRGVWIDGDHVVWHLGDRLEVDGQEVSLLQHRSAHHYPCLPALEVDRTVDALSDAEGEKVLAVVEAMGWSGPFDALHLLGWAVLASVGGALEKRPVLQITSRFGSGKTYVRERVLQPLLAGLAISRSNSTEAGIRGLLRDDTLPVLIDESEGEDPYRRQGHLRLARLSYDGTPTDRGTVSGSVISFAVRSAVALVGINAEITNPAERSRTVVVGRVQLPAAEWAGVDHRILELLTPATGTRLLRRTVTHLHTLRANVATFRRAVEGQLGGGAAARAGDTYGALLAGAHLLTSTAMVSDADAVAWLDAIGWSAAAALGEAGLEEQDAAAEARQCLQHLLSHEEPWRSDSGTGRLTIRELVELARRKSVAEDAEQARKALGRRGIKADDVGLRIVSDAEPLRPIYGATKWRDRGHRARLLDLPGACLNDSTVHFPVLLSKRACTVPWEAIGV